MEQTRKSEFKELHTELLIKVAKEFEKHGFAPSPIQITFDSAWDLTKQEVLTL